MLQQILKDMFVDPELLAALDEDQKQTLFCKMREEQVRRWKQWNDHHNYDEETDDKNTSDNTKKKRKKRVSFMKGIDGEPWVWVMGEHKDDRTIEQILQQEAIEKAREIAEQEAEELRKQVETQLYIELTPASPTIEDPDSLEDIYCSVDELREKINKTKKVPTYSSLSHYNNNLTNCNFDIMAFEDCNKVFQRAEVAKNTPKVAQKVALWERRLTEERTCQIFQSLQKKKQEQTREAEEAEKRQEQMWKEQERKAKEAEQQIREIARRARQEHRLTNFEIDTSYSTVNTGVPPGRSAILEWYETIEKPKGTGDAEPWFHGLITRSEAEKFLLDQDYGSFLIRLSERIWGYAISYRAREKCKHYLVSACGGKYQFLGSNQIEHNSLGDLIEYHRLHPLTGGEKLQQPCPRTNDNYLTSLNFDF